MKDRTNALFQYLEGFGGVELIQTKMRKVPNMRRGYETEGI